MFFKRIVTIKGNDLYVHKVPDVMTDEQIKLYLSDLGHDTNYNDINNVFYKEVSSYRFKTMFPSEDFLLRVELIKDYLSKYKSRDASWIQMKSFICKWLYSQGLIMMDIAKVMSYANHTSIIYFLKEYSDFDRKFKYDDFMKYIEENMYPYNDNGTTKFKKL